MLPLMFVVGLFSLALPFPSVQGSTSVPILLPSVVGCTTFCSIVNVVVTPYMLNVSEANLKSKAEFPAARFTVLLLIWTFDRLPKTKEITTETLDRLFHEGARRFQ